MNRVVLLTHNTPFGRTMARALEKHLASHGHSLAAIAVFSRSSPPQSPKWPYARRLLRTLRRLTSSKTSTLRLRHYEAGFAHQGSTYFEEHAKPPKDWPEGVELNKTTDVNSDHFAGWLKRQNADLLCVAGGPILKDSVLQIPKRGAINMHSSILPAFRGTQAEFWQVYHDAYETAGITIHKIDTGVDTGAILSQKSLDMTELQSPQIMRAKNQLLALTLLPEVAVNMLDNTLQSIAQNSDEARLTFKGKDRTIQARWQVVSKLLQNGIRP